MGFIDAMNHANPHVLIGARESQARSVGKSSSRCQS